MTVQLVMVERNRAGRHLGAEAAAAAPQVPSRNETRAKARTRAVRIMSPPMLPPQWGQAVAPPPTPHFTPQTSPRSAALASDTQMEVYFDSEGGGRQDPPPLMPNDRHDTRSVDDYDRRLHRHHSLLRRHRRLRRVRSTTSSRCSSSCPSSRCHPSCSEGDTLIRIRQQPDTIVYAYSFDGDSIDRRPLTPVSSTGRTAADLIHGFHHPAEQNTLSDYHFNRPHGDDMIDRRSSLSRRHFRHERRLENDSMAVEYHRPPPHNSLSSSPQGGGTTTTASGSVSPDVSPILNVGCNATRLTTSPATPPHRRLHYDVDCQSVISRPVMMTSSRVTLTRSAIRLPSSRPTNSRKTSKTVKWFSDLKKKPQDISEDRKVVKSQVRMTIRLR